MKERERETGIEKWAERGVGESGAETGRQKEGGREGGREGLAITSIDVCAKHRRESRPYQRMLTVNNSTYLCQDRCAILIVSSNEKRFYLELGMYAADH